MDPDRVAKSRMFCIKRHSRRDFPMDEETFVFGSFRLVPAQRKLLDNGKPLRPGSRALDILITLVEHAGETISREQLIATPGPIRSSMTAPCGSMSRRYVRRSGMAERADATSPTTPAEATPLSLR